MLHLLPYWVAFIQALVAIFPSLTALVCHMLSQMGPECTKPPLCTRAGSPGEPQGSETDYYWGLEGDQAFSYCGT